jgi:hypothetical protein
VLNSSFCLPYIFLWYCIPLSVFLCFSIIVSSPRMAILLYLPTSILFLFCFSVYIFQQLSIWVLSLYLCFVSLSVCCLSSCLRSISVVALCLTSLFSFLRETLTSIYSFLCVLLFLALKHFHRFSFKK